MMTELFTVDSWLVGDTFFLSSSLFTILAKPLTSVGDVVAKGNTVRAQSGLDSSNISLQGFPGI